MAERWDRQVSSLILASLGFKRTNAPRPTRPLSPAELRAVQVLKGIDDLDSLSDKGIVHETKTRLKAAYGMKRAHVRSTIEVALAYFRHGRLPRRR